MKRIYSNFDGLDVSFQCALPEFVRRALRDAKEKAQKERKGCLAYLGKNAIPVIVDETGARGGYAFRFRTGLDGEIWFVADSDKRDGWNVKVSASSLSLALHEYKEVKHRILKTLMRDLHAFGVTKLAGRNDYSLERVSRFDFCVDFIAEEFQPEIEHFVAHNRSKKRRIGTTEGLPFESVGQYGRLQTIMIGKMPNRQVVLYNKKQEIASHAKEYWWKIWGIEKDSCDKQIWRVEARAGKKELNKWNLRTFDDFENKAGDVIVSILEAIRYTVPNPKDKNMSRWKNAAFWDAALKAAKTDLENYISHADRKEIISDYRENIIKRYDAHIAGSLVSYAAALGMDISEMPGVLELVAADMLDSIHKNPEKFREKHQKAEEKFVFLGEEKNKKSEISL